MIGLIWFWLFVVPVHDFYVSVCEAEHNPDLRQLEIKVKTFTNDYEEALLKHSGKKLGLDTSEEKADAYIIIEKYLREKIQISINGETVILSYWYHEYEADATWTHLIVEDICDIHEMQFRNEVLMELFDDQTNILRVEIGGKKQYVNLTKNYRYEVFRFD